jgi:RimJ/RimL family protein N-acetyltransferase
METNVQNERVVFRQGTLVVLRPLNKATDLAPCQRWMVHPLVCRFLSSGAPMTLAEEAEWFDGIPKRKDEVVLAIETLEGRYIGNVGLHGIHRTNRTAVAGIVIGEPDCWRKGYAREACQLLLDYAFLGLDLRKVCVEIQAENEGSLALTRALGLRLEGRRVAQLYRDGTYSDLLLLAAFRKDWLSRRKESSHTHRT